MKLLIVEDEDKIARSLEKGLKAEGYIVDVAQDSDVAETLVSAGNYDLVLLDWMIPGKHDGPGLVRLWRDRQEQMPILMLTAKATIGDRVRGLDIGADDYLTKPFSYDELLARIRALLRRPKAHSNNVLRADKLKLDVIAKSVEYRQLPVHLTAQEFRLLEYLLRHRGEVLSKDRLLDHVWADESRVQHNTVETFIANVRKKIGPGEAVIKTVRGYGYKVM
ncbi:MAG TPA: response regulator transcription factor [Candidatus Saccharimonadales bacterium]|jgi:DNA-binding response OmpR family regulator|nr:response regulator transcription factor [Candidatus Saccharimonadales bacterium]